MYICAHVYLWLCVCLWMYGHVYGQSQPGAQACCSVASPSWEWLSTCVSSLPVQPVIFSPAGPGRIGGIPCFGGDPGHLSRKWGNSERVKETKAFGPSDLFNVRIHSNHYSPKQGWCVGVRCGADEGGRWLLSLNVDSRWTFPWVGLGSESRSTGPTEVQHVSL